MASNMDSEPVELRCDNGIKFGELLPEDHSMEVKCRSARCGAERGVVVLHEFDVLNGNLISTRVFREPVQDKKEGR